MDPSSTTDSVLTLALANQTRSLLAELDTRLHSIDAKRETQESALESRSAEAAQSMADFSTNLRTHVAAHLTAADAAVDALLGQIEADAVTRVSTASASTPPTPAVAVGIAIVADNWGGGFDGGEDSIQQHYTVPSIVADNWGGLFDGDNFVANALDAIPTDTLSRLTCLARREARDHAALQELESPPMDEVMRACDAFLLPVGGDHFMPVLRGALFVICSSYVSLFQLPVNFAVSSRGTRRLLCSTCSEVLSYSYRNPARKKMQLQSPFGGDAYNTDEFEQADPESYSEEYELSFGISHSISTEDGILTTISISTSTILHTSLVHTLPGASVPSLAVLSLMSLVHASLGAHQVFEELSSCTDNVFTNSIGFTPALMAYGIDIRVIHAVKSRRSPVGKVLTILQANSLSSKEVERRSCISLEEFICNYFSCDTPIIISGTIDHWLARTKWNDIEYLKEIVGDHIFAVEVGKNYVCREWKQELITFSQLLDRMTSIVCSSNLTYRAQHPWFEQLKELSEYMMVTECCYAGAGELQSLNAWFGPEETVAPLHHDPHHNILAQVLGKKYIRFYHAVIAGDSYPHIETMLSSASQVDLDNIDLNEFPTVESLEFIDCILVEGDLLYIPPKWWHYVRSLPTSFSVSFWWHYKVVDYWLDRGKFGFDVYKYRLLRIEGQEPMGTVNYRVADSSLRCVKLVVSLQHLPSTGSSSGDCAISLRRWLKLPSATSHEASTSLDSEVHSVLLVGSTLLCLTSAKGLWVLGSMPFCQSFFLTLEF
jgi:hypothetical protein